MSMYEIVHAIAHVLSVGMAFDDVLALVHSYTDDVEVTYPSADMYGVMEVGHYYGDSLSLVFDDSDSLEEIYIGSIDDWD